ncbi:type II toxin-antitoxin system VapC family toxin [Candidatus Woesearchaeota archaeon]|nr:type II toxin-antitoxin system VapC family toxin [Candidatus Woesearchaeota archaeon]
MIKQSVVIDTNIFIDHLRGHAPAKVFFKEIEDGIIDGYYSTITEAEIYSGTDLVSLEKQRVVADLLSLMKRVPVDDIVAKKAGELRRSHPTLLPDAIIAATATLRTGGRVCTKNKKDFSTYSTVVTPY